MRRAILCVLAAGLCWAAGDPQTNAPAAPAAKDQTTPPKEPPKDQQKTPPQTPAKPPATPESLSPVVPAVPAARNAEQPGQPAAAADTTDPAKMGASVPKPGSHLPGTAPVDEKTYVIGAEDIVKVMTWGHADVTGDFMVRPDGRISIPLIGEVQASGRTPVQLATEIAELLKASFIRSPNVNVGLTAIHSKKYFIQGEVYKPGSYDLVVPTTVLEALVNAGGFKDFADQKHIVIVRGLKRLPFNYKDVIKGKHVEQNIRLDPGDIIVIK